MSEPKSNNAGQGRRTDDSELQPGSPDLDSLDALDESPTVKGLRRGERLFQHYVLQKMLGKGGMGVVWLARDERLDVDVALKFLPAIFSNDRGAVADLRQEARNTRELTHSNIVRIHSFEQDERCAGISMEYVDGDTLSNLRLEKEDRSFTVEELRPLIRQLCSALTYAHEEAPKKLVHRDLKPANLMLTQARELKVADFGLASRLQQSLSVISVPRGGGTLAYMSPQQLWGEIPSVADDVYALGATIYDLLTGKPPFVGGDVGLQIRDKQPPPMHQRRDELGHEPANIPDEWEDVVAACLAKKPGDRPASVKEVAARLGLSKTTPHPMPVGKKLPEPVPVEDLPPPPPPPVVLPPKPLGPQITWEKRESTPPPPPPPPLAKRVALAGLIILVLAAAGAGWWFGIEKPRRDRAKTVVDEKIDLTPKPTPMPEGDKVSELLKDAQDAFDAGRYPDAKKAYDTVLILSPGNLPATKGREIVVLKEKEVRADDIATGLKAGLGALAAGRYADATKAYHAVDNLDPGNVDAKTGLADVEKAKKEQEDKATKEKKDKIDNGLTTAKQAIADGRYADAVKASQDVLNLDNANEDAKRVRSDAQEAETKRLEARSHVVTGRALLEEKKFDNAETEAQDALRLLPDFPDAKTLKAEIETARAKASAAAASKPSATGSTKAVGTKSTGATKTTGTKTGKSGTTNRDSGGKGKSGTITRKPKPPIANPDIKDDTRKPETPGSANRSGSKPD